MDIETELRSIVEALSTAGVEYAICGGVAVALHGHVRATEDIDLVIHASDADRVVAWLRPTGFQLPAEPMTFDKGEAAEREIRRITKVVGTEHMTLDLISGPAFVSVLTSRVLVPWKGTRLAVVSRDGLRLMKLLAGRPQDLLDLDALDLRHE